MTTTQFGDHPSDRKTVALEDIMPMAKIQETTVALPPHIRCGDQTKTKPATTECAAQAYVEVVFKDGSTMEFCGHCYANREAVLILQATRIIDHRPYLLQQERRFKGVNTR